MLGVTKHQDVKGGRIRSVCPRCKKINYVAVSTNLRRKAVRCKCGKTTYYSLNYRGYYRESLNCPAELFLDNTATFKVMLNDISTAGVGILLRSGGQRIIKPGKEGNVKYRSINGSYIQRKIRIKNRSGNRVGAEFIDALANLAKKII